MFTFLSDKFSSIFSRIAGQRYLTEKNIEETVAHLRKALIDGDVPYGVVADFIAGLQKDLVGQKVRSSLNAGEHFIKIVHDKLIGFLKSGVEQKDFLSSLPAVVMVMGLQGSGKTTTVAKIVHNILGTSKKNGKPLKIVCASVDFCRPAALEQLHILANQIGVHWYAPIVKEPLAATRDIIEYYKKNSFDLLFLDTAGRLHVDNIMLEELKNIAAIAKPLHKLLVLDVMTGQESLRVAQSFNENIGFDGSILTKIDSDARGGAAFAFCYNIKKPLLFVGTGEKIDDLEDFKPERIAGRILGMGDLQTLLERAELKIKESEKQKAEQAFAKDELTLEDFAQQIDMVGRLGSFSSVLKYIPGMNSAALTPDVLNKGEAQVVQFKAIIQSMTPAERINSKLLNSSRKERIAKGAGVRVSDVNLLLQRFEQIKQFVKLFKRSGKFPGF